MSRARVICHMGTSIDSKISGALLEYKGLTECRADYVGLLREKFWDLTHVLLVGGRTVADSSAVVEPSTLPAADPAEVAQLHTDFLEPVVADARRPAAERVRWCGVIDPRGRFAWKQPTWAKGPPGYELFGGQHWLEIVVEDWVSDGFLAHCRRVGIPYLFAGKDRLNVNLMLQKLRAATLDDTVVLIGGGIVNGFFLRENAIDELSVMVSPIVTANTKDVQLFQPASDSPADALPTGHFTLTKHEKTPHGQLWTLYTADSA